MDRRQQSSWRPTRRQLLWAGGIGALAFLVIVICGYLFGWKWTGLPKRTLWDWRELLIIPAVLAIGGYLFTRSENRATQAAAERRAQDEALQAYLDQMGQLLLDKERPLRQSEEGSEVSTLARARTLTVLPRLDGDHRARVVQFLYESGLIGKDSGVVDLTGALLARANLTGANLKGANLRGAHLARASLVQARLSEADLGDAKLFGANLTEAYVSEEQLLVAESLEDATMPNGQSYEEWLRSKGRGEDGTEFFP